MAVASSGGTAATYSYTSGTNQLASVTDAGGTRTIAYDDRGNTEAETRPGSISAALDYDGYGRLVEYDRTDLGTAQFVYNGLDDRVTMSLPTAGTRHFVYDAAGRVMGEYGASASDVQAEFIWMLPEVGAGGPFGGDDGIGGYMPLVVATPDSSATIQLNWIYGDHLGTPLLATDASGDPATTPDDYLAPAFPGQSRMFADLYYNRYRDYDPTTGRYVQADPIGLAGGDNLYGYANENPVNFVDPDGRNPVAAVALVCEAAPAACAAIIAGIVYYGGKLIDACVNAGEPQTKAPILELGPKRKRGRRSPTIPCSSCGAPHGGVTGTTECPDCDKKRQGGYPVKGENPRPLG